MPPAIAMGRRLCTVCMTWRASRGLRPAPRVSRLGRRVPDGRCSSPVEVRWVLEPVVGMLASPDVAAGLEMEAAGRPQIGRRRHPAPSCLLCLGSCRAL